MRSRSVLSLIVGARALVLSLVEGSSPVLAFLVLASPLLAQTKHPFTFEDMMALKRVEEPQPSPDGKWVLFAAVDVDLRANTKTPHVWVVPLNSNTENSRVAHTSLPVASVGDSHDSGERQIISDQDADRPRWALDGKRFAFVSSKENGSQIWIADFDGATGTVTGKHRLTDMPTEADGELWSPDGKNILFKSDVYPECNLHAEGEFFCNRTKVAEAKNSKVKAQIFTHLLYRHWNAYKEVKRTHLFVASVPIENGTNLYDRLTPIPRDLTPGDYDAPVFSLGGQDNYAFSPDGKEVCYASNHDPSQQFRRTTIYGSFQSLEVNQRTSPLRTRLPTTLRSIRRMEGSSPIARSSARGTRAIAGG
jgi:dipeptidyl aminopeptidase/acylaminoacyl peptidase